MAFKDCFMTDTNGLSLPKGKFDRMLESGQFQRIDEAHVVRVHSRKTGDFLAGQHVLDWPGWLQVHDTGDRVELNPVLAQHPVDAVATAAPVTPEPTPPPEPNIAAPSTAAEDRAALAAIFSETAPGGFPSGLFEVEVTKHARERWRERVVPFLQDTDDSNETINEALDQAQRIENPAEQREDTTYYRLLIDGCEAGWIEFVVAGAESPMARIVTIETQQSHAESFPEEKRRKLSDSRRGRASSLSLSACAWTVVDPDGKPWTVSKGGGTTYPYFCDCPDYAYTAGRAQVSCKHIWAVREALEDTAEGVL